jgi:shikimate kinase
MEEFRKKCALVLIDMTTRKCADDFVIALPPRGLMGPYLRVVRDLDVLTVVLKDKAENILSRIVFYDIDSDPIEKHLTKTEERLYLKEIKAEWAYFERSYRRADLTVDLFKTQTVQDAVEKVERALRGRMQRPVR